MAAQLVAFARPSRRAGRKARCDHRPETKPKREPKMAPLSRLDVVAIVTSSRRSTGVREVSGIGGKGGGCEVAARAESVKERGGEKARREERREG